MIARQIFDKFLTLPAAITCDTELVDNSVENSAKRNRSACSECASFSLPIARHENALNLTRIEQHLSDKRCNGTGLRCGLCDISSAGVGGAGVWETSLRLQ